MTISSWEPAIQSTGSGWARQAGQGTVARHAGTAAAASRLELDLGESASG